MNRDIKELMEGVDFVIEFSQAVDKTQSGPVGWGTVVNFVPAIMKAPQAFAGLKEIPAELNDLDDLEKEMLCNRIRDLDLDDDFVEEVAEASMKAALDIYTAINRLIGKINEAKILTGNVLPKS